jgi:hypothetical protein
LKNLNAFKKLLLPLAFAPYKTIDFKALISLFFFPSGNISLATLDSSNSLSEVAIRFIDLQSLYDL